MKIPVRKYSDPKRKLKGEDSKHNLYILAFSSITKFENKGTTATFSCSCADTIKEKDEIKLKFDDFFNLMSTKIT